MRFDSLADVFTVCMCYMCMNVRIYLCSPPICRFNFALSRHCFWSLPEWLKTLVWVLHVCAYAHMHVCMYYYRMLFPAVTCPNVLIYILSIYAYIYIHVLQGSLWLWSSHVPTLDWEKWRSILDGLLGGRAVLRKWDDRQGCVSAPCWGAAGGYVKVKFWVSGPTMQTPRGG